MKAAACAMTAWLSRGLYSWMRSTRGSVSVEFALGAVIVLTVTVGGLDVYRIIDAQAVTFRAAATMADYVSLEEAPTRQSLEDLAEFSYRNEIGLPSEAAFVVSLIGRAEATDTESDPPAILQWDGYQWRHPVGGEDPDSPPEQLAEDCGSLGDNNDGGEATLQEELAMEPGEQVVVVEVCVKLMPRAFVSGAAIAGNVLPTLFYRHHIIPVRGETPPTKPT